MNNRFNKESIETLSKKYIGLEFGPFIITKFAGRYSLRNEKYERNHFEKECKFCGKKNIITTSIIEKQLQKHPICRCRSMINIHTNEKKCSSCKQWFPADLENFHKLEKRSFGISYYCKNCNNSKSRLRCRIYREKNPKSNESINHFGHKKTEKKIESDVKKLKEEFLDKEFGSFIVTKYDGRYRKCNSEFERYYFEKECKFCGKKTIQPVSQLRLSIKNEINCNLCKESVNIYTKEKKCADCQVWYPATSKHFPLSKNRPFGVHYYCLGCHNKKGRKRRESKEVRNKEYKQKRYREETDPLYKMTCRIRVQIKNYIKRVNVNKPKPCKTTKILGCSFQEFKAHLENQFDDKMSWDNYGKWHLEHMIPVTYGKTPEEVIELCHYSNYQPMWGDENQSKLDKLYIDQIPEENKIKFKKYIERYINNLKYVRHNEWGTMP